MKLQVGVKALIRNSGGQYLLIERSEPLADGTGIRWDIPGGRIKEGERLEEALAREVKEEVGVILHDTPQLIKAQDIIIPDIAVHVVRLTYVVELDTNVALGKEHQKFTWVSKVEALQFNIDPYLRRVLAIL